MSLGDERSSAVSPPYFFLSYARTPKLDPSDASDPDRWVYKLYRDLCETILQLTAAHPRRVGFMDRENRPGANWPRELAHALATCRVFVPLYSPRYFSSDNCGKEWFAFARRELNHRALGFEAPGAIVPALWARVRSAMLPEVARSIQYAHHDLGSRYSAEGFYGIIKLERYRRDYQMAVHELARRIVDVAHETQVSSEPPADYFSLESAFGSADSLGTATEMMNIAVVALDTSTLPDGRTGEYYGNTARTWNPYRPEASLPLADYAAELTTCFGCQSAVGTFDEHIARRAASGELMSPCLCLIDPWTTVSPAHQEKLQRLDALDQSWVSVLVPWNCRDAQMTAAEEDLRQGLSLSLSRKLASVPERCRLAATGIPSLREFSELLPQMAAIMLKRFRKDAPSYPPPGPVIERGRLRQADPADSGGLS